MVATVMLLCKFGNYILSATATGSNSALSCYPTQNISSPVIKEFKEEFAHLVIFGEYQPIKRRCVKNDDNTYTYYCHLDVFKLSHEGLYKHGAEINKRQWYPRAIIEVSFKTVEGNIYGKSYETIKGVDYAKHQVNKNK